MAVNVLVSFAFSLAKDLGKFRAAMPCGRLMVDSGAFTAYTVGKKVSLDAYAEFLTNFAGSWDCAVTLDVIGDPVATRRNTKKLHDRGIRVMPVFTRGGKVAEFEAMVKDFGYVCVGGGVGLSQEHTIARLAGLQRRAEELGGGIHALGVGNMNALRKIRPYSSDASNVSAAFLFGNVVCYDGRNLRSFMHTNHKTVRENLHHLKAAGLEMGALAKAGRHPRGEARDRLMQGMSLAHACADEDAVGYGVPVPHGVKDTPGTHMFNSVTAQWMGGPVAQLDGLLHDPAWPAPPLWRRYGARHGAQCRAKAAVAA